MSKINFVKIAGYASIILAAVTGAMNEISNLKKEARINDMENRIRLLEKNKAA